jgi:hypothetical protein
MSSTRRDKAYQEGMVFGPGGHATGPIKKHSGSGTLSDPDVYWLGHPRLEKPQLNACSNIARGEAIQRRLTVVVVRRGHHNTVLRRDATGRTVTNPNTGRPQVDPSDWHLTILLGNSLEDIVLQGHIYVNVDDNCIPTGVMDPEDRTVIHPGKQRVPTEYWGVNGSLGHDYIDGPSTIPTTDPHSGIHPAHQADSWRKNASAQGGQNNTPTLRVNFGRDGTYHVDSQYYQRNGKNRNIPGRSFHNESSQRGNASAPAPAASPWALENTDAAAPVRANGLRGVNRFSALLEE